MWSRDENGAGQGNPKGMWWLLTAMGQLQETATVFVFGHVQRPAGTLFDLADAPTPFKAVGFFGRVPVPKNMIKRD